MSRASSSSQQDKFHVRVMFTLLSSESWERLDNNAKVLYLYFMKRELVNKWKGDNPRTLNPRFFHTGNRAFEERGIDAGSLCELRGEVGFLDIPP